MGDPRRYADHVLIDGALKMLQLRAFVFKVVDPRGSHCLPAEGEQGERGDVAGADLFMVHYERSGAEHYDSVRAADGTLWTVPDSEQARVRKLARLMPPVGVLHGAGSWEMNFARADFCRIVQHFADYSDLIESARGFNFLNFPGSPSAHLEEMKDKLVQVVRVFTSSFSQRALKSSTLSSCRPTSSSRPSRTNHQAFSRMSAERH